jgi:CRISPR-associated protein Cas1
LDDPAVEKAIEGLRQARLAVRDATDCSTVMGYEGAGTAAYFGCFDRLLRHGWVFPGRHKRPPTDPVNALLSFGYTILTNAVASAVKTVGLDPMVGYLHQLRYGKPSLALDLVEEFRPLVVDSTVLTVLNNRMIEPGGFTYEIDVCQMNGATKRTYLSALEERLDTAIEHPVFGYKATYRRCLELQARLLSKYLLGEIESYPPFIVR